MNKDMAIQVKIDKYMPSRIKELERSNWIVLNWQRLQTRNKQSRGRQERYLGGMSEDSLRCSKAAVNKSENVILVSDFVKRSIWKIGMLEEVKTGSTLLNLVMNRTVTQWV